MTKFGKKKSGPRNVYLRGNYWWWSVRIGGKSHYGPTAYLEDEPSKAIAYAQKKKKELREEYRARLDAMPKHDLSLTDAADAWWLAKSPKFRKDGERPPVDNAFRQMERAVDAFGADTMVTAMNLALFQRVRGELLEADPHPSGRGRPLEDDGLKSCSVNHILRCGMKVLFHIAAVRKDIDLSDMPDPERDDLYLPELGRTQYMSEIDETMFCESAKRLAAEAAAADDDRRDYREAASLTRYMNLTGMRTKEAFSLRWDQIDWSALTENMNFRVKARGLDARIHPVFLEEEALEILDERMASKDAHDVYVFSAPSRSTHWNKGPVKKGDILQWTHNRFGTCFKEIGADSGVTDRIPHDCRRTAARRIWLSRGIEIAQAFLGHKQRQTTLDYIGITEEDVSAAKQALEIDRARIRTEIEAALALGKEPPLFSDKRIRRIGAEIDRRRRLNAKARGDDAAVKKRQAAIRALAKRAGASPAPRLAALGSTLPATSESSVNEGGRPPQARRGSGRRPNA
jgi:integrase